jgi:signal peptidase I
VAWLKTRKGIIVILAVLLLIIFIIWNTFFGFYQGTGKSMEPAMAEGEVYIVKKNPDYIQRGDIIVFKAPGLNQIHTKRVVAFGNEMVEIKEGQLYINGEKFEEPYLLHKNKSDHFKPVHVPTGQYFVLGDVRSASQDSRYYGAIKKDDIIGVVIQ